MGLIWDRCSILVRKLELGEWTAGSSTGRLRSGKFVATFGQLQLKKPICCIHRLNPQPTAVVMNDRFRLKERIPPKRALRLRARLKTQ